MRSRHGPWFGGIVLLINAAAIILMGISVIPQTLVAQASTNASRSRGNDAILGEWWTEGRKGRVRFERYKDGTFIGVTTCCKPEKPTKDSPGTDVHNPDPKKRNRSTVGIVLVWKLRYDAEGKYEDGYVYNPRDGKTYRMNIEVIDANTLAVRGYLGISLFGETQTWKRVRK